SFQDKKWDFTQLADNIIKTAKALSALGIKKGDKVTVCMPNTPQGVYCLYAINYIGAVASMIHPLSAVHEIAFYLKEAESKTIITLDQFYGKIEKVRKITDIDNIIIARISDVLNPIKCLAYRFLKERKFPKVVEDGKVIKWNNFIKKGKSVSSDPYVEKKGKDIAVILFSGGTTGTSKGIQLSNLNFNALAYQTGTMSHEVIEGAKMLAAMPIFHGFGLGVCIHTMMFFGGESILVPQVSVKGYAHLLKTSQPNFIAGVPTLFEGITRNKEMEGVDLSCLRGVFSGGDTLPIELKKKIDKFLAEHNAKVRVREGYGTTECVTASCLTPYNKEKEGSIGIPFPDTYYKIFKPGTQEELPYGEEGEICLRGKTVMVGYINHEEENAQTLQKHPDGHIWLHTGDVGYMDEEGFIFFRQRIKRMIVTSGYNVYPSQLENVINELDIVRASCCIGVPDPYKMHKVKAFVVLADGVKPSEEAKQEVLRHCREHIAKYAMPYDVEFRDDLPKTLVGKIAYTVLEKEEEEKMKAAQAAQ
ncbi:MAG: AMP-binding protein, partial [Sphaerochaetaceae bacterium]|nr:AMP-binding protein [Sphaerochaetaceae bacterium]